MTEAQIRLLLILITGEEGSAVCGSTPVLSVPTGTRVSPAASWVFLSVLPELIICSLLVHQQGQRPHKYSRPSTPQTRPNWEGRRRTIGIIWWALCYSYWLWDSSAQVVQYRSIRPMFTLPVGLIMSQGQVLCNDDASSIISHCYGIRNVHDWCTLRGDAPSWQA